MAFSFCVLATRLTSQAGLNRCLFALQAIKVVMLAQEEARRLGHNFVGTEQILLGLIGESTGIAAKVLKSMGVNLKDARVEVEKIIGALPVPLKFLTHLVPSSQALCKGCTAVLHGKTLGVSWLGVLQEMLYQSLSFL